MSAEALASATAATESASPALIVGGVLVAFGVVVMAVMATRKYISNRPEDLLPVSEGGLSPLGAVRSE